jgi:hypothetical protein
MAWFLGGQNDTSPRDISGAGVPGLAPYSVNYVVIEFSMGRLVAGVAHLHGRRQRAGYLLTTLCADLSCTLWP